MGWFDEGGSGTRVDVVALLDSKASEMITEMISAGALVSVGLTSDGGALGVTITVDGRWRREYFRDSAQLELWCEDAMAPVCEAAAARLASSADGRRTRRSRGA